MSAASATPKLSQPMPNPVVVLCLVGGAFIQALDMTIANVALPYMQGGLSAGRDQITWVVTSYVVASAVMTSPVGWLAARIGRKKFFIYAIIGFTLASVLCGIARSLEEMVIFRILQGGIGAALLPLSQSMILDVYPAEKKSSAAALWGSGILLGPVLGPTLGGVLTDYLNWRWVFFVNIPAGILVTLGVIFLYHEKKFDVRVPRFDAAGFALLSIALGALQLVLDRGTTEDWFNSAEIQIEAAIAALAFYLFIVHSMTTKNPFIPFHLFADANLMAGLIAMTAVGMFIFTSMTLFPPYLQLLSGYTVTETGLLMGPRGVATIVSIQLAARYLQKVDPRWCMLAATASMAYSCWRMAQWTPDVSQGEMLLVNIFQGIGSGLFFGPINLRAFATLAESDRTNASMLLALVRNIGGGIGVSVSASYLAYSVQQAHANLAESVTPFNRALQHGAAGMMWNPNIPFGLEALNRTVERQAVIIAYSHDFMLLLTSCVLALFAIFLIRTPKSVPSAEPPQFHAMD